MRDGDGLALKVRRWRERRGKTQQAVADALGVGRVIVTNIESGRRRLFAEEIPALCKALDVTPGEFFEPVGQLEDEERDLLGTGCVRPRRPQARCAARPGEGDVTRRSQNAA